MASTTTTAALDPEVLEDRKRFGTALVRILKITASETKDIEANAPPVETKPKPADCYKCRRQFLHVPVKKIKMTFAASTQNAATAACGPKANQTLKSPNPSLNIRQRKEAASITVISISASN